MPFLLLTIAGLFVATVAGIRAIMKRRRDIAKKIARAAAIWLAVYLGILLAVSFASRERVLAFNEEKRFCGFYLDCHLACSVVEAYQTKTLGEPPNQQTANGIYYVVTVKVSSNARQATLQLYNPVAKVIDDQGRQYERAAEAEAALELAPGKSVTLVQAVAANDSYTKTLVFDVPVDARNPYLLVTEGHWFDHLVELFIIGDEDSMFHKKAKFRLEV